MINIKDKKNCCGCQACGDACPKSAISFKTDNEGFWYPEVDKAMCVNCGLCERTCPVLRARSRNVVEAVCSETSQAEQRFERPTCVAAINKNLAIRFDSTSGGMFTALAEKTLQDGGYVVGAVYTDTWGVRWLASNDAESLPQLRSSKYLQSDSAGMYSRIRALLNQGEKVLVCALPCQIAAVRAFLGKSYDNLLLVDLICRYINSPLAYRKYLDSLEKEFGGRIVHIKAKSKELGWRNLTHKCVFDNGRTYYGTFAEDIFMKASMRLNCLSRPACYSCAFKGFPRMGDITIGDYWIDRSTSPLDDDTGTSVVLLNSGKGELYFKSVSKRLKIEDVPLEKVLPGNPALETSLSASRVDRRLFFERIQREDFRVVVEDMSTAMSEASVSVKSRLRTFLRPAVRLLRSFHRGFSMAQCHLSTMWQFVYLNFFHPAVHSDWRNDCLIYPTPHCLFEIDKTASVELHGPLCVGTSPFKKSRVETRIKVQRGARMVIGSSYAFGYGSDIEIFPNAYFESKGGLPTNSFTTIICQEKIVIGKNVACGRNVTLRDNNGGHLISVNGYRDSRPIIIGDHAWLTQSVTIMSGVKIGDGTIVSAGSLVNSSFPAFCVVAGTPAHITQRDIYWKM